MPAGADAMILPVLLLNVTLAALIVLLIFRVRSLARRVAAAGGDPRSLDRLAAAERGLGAVTNRIEHLATRTDRLGEQTARCLQRVGLVRYDAFKELGGHLSFSVALLDAKQDGVVVSVLNARDGARAYAKPVVGGRATVTLSEEEERAISQA